MFPHMIVAQEAFFEEKIWYNLEIFLYWLKESVMGGENVHFLSQRT